MIADGVNITDAAFGGIGTFSRGGRHEELPTPQTEKTEAVTDKPEDVMDKHEDVFGSVYINATGYPMFMSEKVTGFPEGSTIVREKLIGLNAPVPELLTVMVKRSKGFNPAGGDWEYMVVNGEGTTIRERGQLGSCNACHVRQKESDFVFRTYLLKQQGIKQP
jgi:hypothetical protein